MSLTISPSPFGSLVVSVAETGSTLSVSTVATSPSVLSMALGVPGPAGATGATGATGQGVAAGGTTGQALVKLSNSDYATTWATISSGGGTWGSITGTLSNQTDLKTALDGKLSLSGGTMAAGALVNFSADVNSNTSELGAWGLGIDNANAGETAYIQSNQIRIYNGDFLNGTSLTANGINFNDETTQTTAYNPAVLGNYLPLAGGIMSGAIRFDSVGTQNIAKGSFDSGRGGYNGISLNCAVDYELNWQAGYLKALNSGGFTVPVNFDSSIVLSDDVFASDVSKSISANAIDGGSYSGFNLVNGGSSYGANLTINFGNTDEGYNNQAILYQSSLTFKETIGNTTFASYGAGGITFNDSTVQTTAGLPLTGGTVTGQIKVTDGMAEESYIFINPTNIDCGGNTDKFTIDGTNGLHNFANSEYTKYSGYGVTFSDNTTQTTAGLPLTGGTLTGGLTIAGGASDVYFNITGDTGKSLSFGTDTEFNVSISDINLIFDNNGLNLSGTGNKITFPDSTTQTTAFPGYTGTTSQYIDGTGALQTYGPLGDRYFTTSNSTLTCDSGDGKTMTIGTGLSYSRQQDITVSYNNSNHMHGTVLTYDSATGVMTFDSNTHSGGGTYSSWEVNVGGVAGAVLPVGGTTGQVLAKINSTNFNTEWISLGSMATQPASAYLSTASAVANYQTISGMSAYLSTSAASSTYLTQSNASSTYLTQANASTTYIGTSAYATTAQAQAGTSTTTVVSPSTLLDAKWFAGGKSMVQISWSTSVSGVGASAFAQNSNARLNIAPTTATGYAISSAVIANNSRGTVYNSGFDFSKRVAIGLRVARNVASPDTASVWRFSIGKSSGTDASDISAKGLQVKVAGSGALQLLVHNGTTLTTTTSSYTPANGVSYDIVVTSDGAGACVLYVNGTSVATSSGGPTTAGSTTANTMVFEVQNTSVITGSPQSICISDYFVQVNS